MLNTDNYVVVMRDQRQSKFLIYIHLYLLYMQYILYFSFTWMATKCLHVLLSGYLWRWNGARLIRFYSSNGFGRSGSRPGGHILETFYEKSYWWPNQQCQSTEGGWLVIQTGLSLTRLTSPCYNNTTCMQMALIFEDHHGSEGTSQPDRTTGGCPPTFWSGGDALCFVPLLFWGVDIFFIHWLRYKGYCLQNVRIISVRHVALSCQDCVLWRPPYFNSNKRLA